MTKMAATFISYDGEYLIGVIEDAGMRVVTTIDIPYREGKWVVVEGMALPDACANDLYEVWMKFRKEQYGRQSLIKVEDMKLRDKLSARDLMPKSSLAEAFVC